MLGERERHAISGRPFERTFVNRLIPMTHTVGTSFRMKFAKRQSRLNPFGDRFWMSCKIILISHSSLIVGCVYQKVSSAAFFRGHLLWPSRKRQE